jgi:hypothetical protein
MLNGSSHADVTLNVTATLVLPDGDQLLVWADLRYDLSDPYAIHATFTPPSGLQVPWVFARELLTKGMHGAAGIGDVTVWGISPDDQRDVYIALRSPTGEALFQFSGAELASFLGRTYVHCLPGDEHVHLDVDLAIERLLAS